MEEWRGGTKGQEGMGNREDEQGGEAEVWGGKEGEKEEEEE